MNTSGKPLETPPSDELGTNFLALLPMFQRHASRYFRDVPCPDARADKVAETIALAWKWYRRLHEQGKDVSRFAMTFVCFVATGVRRGRRLCGQERAHDVLSPVAQWRHGFKVRSTATSTRESPGDLLAQSRNPRMQGTFDESLRDNTQTPVPEQVAFRLDWPTYFNSLSERDRMLAEFLSFGHSAKKAAAKFGLSPARVTQLRQRWCREWQRLQDVAAVEP